LELLRGCLILFDLGYWDYLLLVALKDNGVFFLSRVKANAVIRIVKVVEGLPKRRFEGRQLLGRNFPNPKKKIIEILGEFSHGGVVVLHARVIGFWSPKDKSYHWYVTNLTVSAHLIYPLYRIRWQLELIFKACKSSLRLADQPSANENIIKSLTLLSLIAQLIGFAIGKKAVATLNEAKQNAFSFQRAATLLVHIGHHLFCYLVSNVKTDFIQLLRQIQGHTTELFDPNYQHRETSMQRMCNLRNQQ